MWTSILTILASPAFLGTWLQALDLYIAKNAKDTATLAAVQKISAFLQSQGVKNATAAYSAEVQIAQGDQMWDDVENPPKPTTPTTGVNTNGKT